MSIVEKRMVVGVSEKRMRPKEKKETDCREQQSLPKQKGLFELK